MIISLSSPEVLDCRITVIFAQDPPPQDPPTYIPAGCPASRTIFLGFLPKHKHYECADPLGTYKDN